MVYPHSFHGLRLANGEGLREYEAAITGLLDHVSWGIEPWDTAKVKAELEKRGLDPQPDMVGKFQSFHLRDPDGGDLQISNQKDTSEL
jgi:hypothetical protein